MAIEILYEDQYLLACVKPAGMISEDGGLPDELQKQLNGKRVFCVHRLDRDVGGVMIYAKDGKTAAKLSEAISEHEARKEYLLICEGIPEEEEGTYKDLLFHDRQKNKTYVVQRERKGVKDAELDYKVIAVDLGKNLTLASALLKTGRSHQIRVQFASRKLPLAGDKRYGSARKNSPIMLWSYFYQIVHPVTGEMLSIKKTPPAQDEWTPFCKTIEELV